MGHRSNEWVSDLVNAFLRPDLRERLRSDFIVGQFLGDGIAQCSGFVAAIARQVFADLAGDTLVRLGYEQSNDWKSWGACPEAPAAIGSTA